MRLLMMLHCCCRRHSFALESNLDRCRAVMRPKCLTSKNYCCCYCEHLLESQNYSCFAADLTCSEFDLTFVVVAAAVVAQNYPNYCSSWRLCTAMWRSSHAPDDCADQSSKSIALDGLCSEPDMSLSDTSDYIN